MRLECSGRNGISGDAKGDDPTCSVSFELRRDAFEMLKCTERTFLYVNVKRMNMILRDVKRQSHVVELCATKNELTVTVKEKHTGEVVSHRGKLLTGLNGHNWSCERPSPVYNCDARMPSADLKRIVGQLDKLPHLSEPFSCCIALHRWSSSISFSVQENSNTPQNEPSRSPHTFTQSGSDTSVMMVIREDCFRVKINGRLLCHIMRLTPLSKVVYLKMSPDRPLEFEYDLLAPASKTSIGRFSLFIKPIMSAASLFNF